MPVKEYKVKVVADDKGLQGSLEQLNKLAENDPTIMDEFYSRFSGSEEVATVAASAVVAGELVCVLTASQQFLEFLAVRQGATSAS